MFSNVAIDVVIGLIFIYLLYSLFATVVSEMIATWLGLRARNLKEAVNRMLTNEEVTGFWNRLIDSLKLMKNPDSEEIKNFYGHPEIKQLGSSGIFKNPSSFKSESFSKTIMYMLNESGPITRERIDIALRNAEKRNIITEESHRYVLSLWEESYGDIVKFKLYLEAWFDRSMEQATEWYKRKIQIILLLLGFCIAWFFNADTFTIIGKLANDKDARAQMVAMATAYVETNPRPGSQPVEAKAGDSTVAAMNGVYMDKTLDSLILIKKKLEQDISNANSILGLGSWPSDSVYVTLDLTTRKKVYTPNVDVLALTDEQRHVVNAPICFSRVEKWRYFFRLLIPHFFGFLVTAIAISLGAPFWFDLLNKLIKLRTSEKQDTNSTAGSEISPLQREA